MSRAALTTVVAFASFALFNGIASIVAAAVWRVVLRRRATTRAAQRAQTLIRLRLFPTLAAVAITSLVVLPAFAIYEPETSSENAGPVVTILAAVGALQLAVSIAIAATASRRTRAVARRWLRGSLPLSVNPPAGVPAYVIESPAPIVALIGVFKPTLVAARKVIDACSTDELTTIVAHERGHLHSRDNLKRWLMACAPDALRWTRVHGEIAAAWHNAAEDAADDAATGAGASARVELAALIVKIARLSSVPAAQLATVSPFVEPATLNRRVRRLLDEHTGPGNPPSTTPWIAFAIAGAAAAALVAARPAVLEPIYLAAEALIRFGR
jgi:Zn-dependent protease with chaperone function